MEDKLIEACSLLSSMYLCKPDRETLNNWRAMLEDNASDILSEIKDAIQKTANITDEELENLIWEYTRLFIGPYKLPCPPWESVYTSAKKLMMQEAYDEVRSFYMRAGLTIEDFGIMPDHIGVELHFLAVLLQTAKSNPEKETFYRNLTQDFIAEHIMKWVPQFALDMEEAAESDVYKALARITSQVLSFFH